MSADDRPVVLLGAGGHAGVVLELLVLCAREVVGVVTREPAPEGIAGVRWLGDDAILPTLAPDVVVANAIGSTGSMEARRRGHAAVVAAGLAFTTLVHPRAIVSPSAVLADGAQVLAGAVVGTGARIGADTIVNTAAVVEHDAVVGDLVHIASGAVLAGGTTVGEGTHVGLGARVVQGVRIGSNCVVGAGAVVLHDVADGERVVGVPARRLTTRAGETW